MKAKSMIALLLAVSMMSGSMSAAVSASEADTADSFAARLSEKYLEPGIEDRTELRWWMGEGPPYR